MTSLQIIELSMRIDCD